MPKQLLDHTFHNAASFFDVGHLAATKEHRDLDFVFVLEEAHGFLHFEVDIVLACLGPQSNLLRFCVVGTVALFLLLVVFVLAVVHDSANWRPLIGGHFHQIESRFAGQFQGVFCSDNSQLLSVLGNGSNR